MKGASREIKDENGKKAIDIINSNLEPNLEKELRNILVIFV